MTLIVRDENIDDRAAIRQVVTSAFGQAAEAELVDALRADGDSAISLVALEDDQIVGHVLFSCMTAPSGTLGLGPVSVLPAHQQRGIGQKLIRAGLARAVEDDWRNVVVLGEPAYYSRFGFQAALVRNLALPYAGPFLQGLALNGAFAASGKIIYPPAFSRFE